MRIEFRVVFWCALAMNASSIRLSILTEPIVKWVLCVSAVVSVSSIADVCRKFATYL